MSIRSKSKTKPAGARFAHGVKLVSLLAFCFIPNSPVEEVSPTFYRGGTPTEEMLQELKGKGVKTLINVRTNPLRRIEQRANKLGFNYFHIRTGIFIAPDDDSVREFLSIAHNPAYQPVYVFCNKGCDRTSFFAALEKVANGEPVDAVIEDMHNHGLKSWWPVFNKYTQLVRVNSEQFHKRSSDVSQPQNQDTTAVGN